MEKGNIKNLKKRYLIWLYKTTKEALDRTERKFTQLEIDKLILKELVRSNKEKSALKFIEEFKCYIRNKEKEGLALKYENGRLKPDYYFLGLKLKAIEQAIIKELGRPALRNIKKLYEETMLKRIMEERQEKI